MAIDVMLDLETTGVEAGAGILSIGAVTLSLESKFYCKIYHPSCTQAGLKDSSETMAWWNKQSVEARTEAFGGNSSLDVALGSFSDYLNGLAHMHGEVFLWGNGADFDLPILSGAYSIVGMKKPWKPFNGRCYRTMKNWPLFKEIRMEKFEGTKHNALDDAVNQAKHLRRILSYSKSLTTTERS